MKKTPKSDSLQSIGGQAAAKKMTPAQKEARARAGGYGAAKAMTAKQRSERAMRAAKARWKP